MKEYPTHLTAHKINAVMAAVQSFNVALATFATSFTWDAVKGMFGSRGGIRVAT